MRKSKGIVCLILVLTMVFWGCGAETPPEAEKEIALLDPVDDPGGWEAASRRNLYDAEVYSAAVFPYTEEYSFDAGVTFDRFGAYPGQYVKKGDVLAYGDNGALEEAVRKKEEQILQMEKEFQEYLAETEESLKEPVRESDYLEDIVENLLETKPEEYLPAGGTVSGNALVPVRNPAYVQWKEVYDRYEGDYRILSHQVDMAEAELEQRTCLYELDHGYALQQLERMKEELRQGILASSMEGVVMAAGQWRNGSFVSERDSIAAVGDPDRKMLRCGYINKLTIAEAADVYAMIHGRRYEIVYEPMDGEEYARRSARKETIYSTFYLAEEAEELCPGDFAVITVVKDMRENVLSVPESALHKDGTGSFVYVLKDGRSTAVNVETGMSDGVYREILEGIREGDRVLASQVMEAGEGRASVERGEFHGSFTGSGYLTYPSVFGVRNPVVYGRTYFVEYAAVLYQHVEQGDVIARIRVEPDQVELARNQVKLERLRERLVILQRRLEEDGGDNRSLQKTITAGQEEIARTEELIAEMTADASRVCVVAQQSGIVVSLAEYVPEDVLGQDALLAEIAEEDNCYVILENRNQLLQYGNQVRVTYTDENGLTQTALGTVANLSEAGTESGLRSEYSLIALPPESVGSMAAAEEDESGRMFRRAFPVEADIRRMDQVLVIPREAVWEWAGRTYVLTEEDGVVTARGFIAGGCDASRYWVVDGLAEGMRLCLK